MTNSYPKFHYKSITWGTFFILVGLYLLLRNNLHFGFDFGFLLNLWPLILLIFGIGFIVKDSFVRMLLAFSKGIVLSLLLIGLISTEFNLDWFHFGSVVKFNKQVVVFDDDNDNDNNNDETDSSSVVNFIYSNGRKSLANLDSIKYAKLKVQAGAGYYKLINSNNYLITLPNYSEGELKDSKEDFNIIIGKDSNNVEMSYEFNAEFTNKKKDITTLELGSKPIWNLDLEFGGGRFDIDMSKNTIKDINVNSGASSVNIKIGKIDTVSNINLSTGLAYTSISLPKNTACFIKTEMALSLNKFPNFVKSGDSYKTKNFDSALKKLYINLEGGISNYVINWY